MKLDDQTYQKDNNKIENTFLYKIPDDNLRNYYKYQFYNFSLQENKTEWDTIMIIPEFSAIINIEVKRGSNDSSDKLKLLEDASDQTKQHFSFMQKLFGGMLSKDWVFVKAAYVPYLEIVANSTMPCGNCQQFILLEKDVDNEVPWLKQLINNKLVKSHYFQQTVYENIVAELIYHISIKESSKFDKQISDPFTISRETEKAFTGKTDGISGESSIPKNMLTGEQLELTGKAERISGESSIPKNMLTDEQLALTGKTDGISGESSIPKNMLTDEQSKLLEKIGEPSEDNNDPLYMLNNKQLQAVYSPAKFLIIDGDYGTGKTYVLKERAKKCAKDNSNHQLFYIDMTALLNLTGEQFLRAESSLMEILATKDFDSYPNIRVITIKDLGISDIFPRKTNLSKLINALNSFLRDNHCDHLFIDEMIKGETVFPDSIETICVNLKVVYFRKNLKNKKENKWLETMKVNHNAVHVSLTKNMRNSQQIIHLAKALEQDSTQQMSCSLDTNVMGVHNFFYRNIYGISSSLLAVAAVNKFFIHKPKESIVVLSNKPDITQLFECFSKRLSSTTSVVRDFKSYMEKPEGILVTSVKEFQGAQARNIIICDTKDTSIWSDHMRNMILRTMSHAIIILDKDDNALNSSGAIEVKNLHEFIYPEEKAPACHFYHNKDKYDISALTLAILEKYKLLDQDGSIAIITYPRISKDIIREANTKEFLSLPVRERAEQVEEKIKLENRELYKDVKRNIDRNYAHVSWSYYFDSKFDIKKENLVNKPRHINYINMNYVPDLERLSEFKNIIVFADENIDHKHEFGAWEGEWSLGFGSETRILVKRSQEKRNLLLSNQPKFAIVVHDDNFEAFCHKGALNLIEDDSLHEYIPRNTNLFMKEEHTAKEVEQVNNLPNQ